MNDNKVKSVFICNSGMKILTARQYIEISKKDLFNEISYFIRFFNENKDRNNFEINNTRYVYIPIYDLYIILMCHISFNFFEALEIIKKIYKIILEICHDRNKFEIDFKNNLYDIILAIDDIVSLFFNRDGSNTTKESINMFSLNEKEYTEEQRLKEEKARNNIIKSLDEINKLKKENKYLNNSVSSESLLNNEKINNNSNINLSNNQSNVSGLNLKELLIKRLLNPDDRGIGNIS